MISLTYLILGVTGAITGAFILAKLFDMFMDRYIKRENIKGRCEY